MKSLAAIPRENLSHFYCVMGLILYRTKLLGVSFLDFLCNVLSLVSSRLHRPHNVQDQRASGCCNQGIIKTPEEKRSERQHFRHEAQTTVTQNRLSPPSSLNSTLALHSLSPSPSTNLSSQYAVARSNASFPPELEHFYTKTEAYMKAINFGRRTQNNESTKMKVSATETHKLVDSNQASKVVKTGSELTEGFGQASGIPQKFASEGSQEAVESLQACYVRCIEDLWRCQKAVNEKRRLSSQARAVLKKADLTLQCIQRQNICSTQFCKFF